MHMTLLDQKLLDEFGQHPVLSGSNDFVSSHLWIPFLSQAILDQAILDQAILDHFGSSHFGAFTITMFEVDTGTHLSAAVPESILTKYLSLLIVILGACVLAGCWLGAGWLLAGCWRLAGVAGWLGVGRQVPPKKNSGLNPNI